MSGVRGIQANPLPDGRYILTGNTFNVKDVIKSYGGKFNGLSKGWIVEAKHLSELEDKLDVVVKDEPAMAVVADSKATELIKVRDKKTPTDDTFKKKGVVGYFGPELNEWLNTNTPHDYGLMNIDTLTTKWMKDDVLGCDRLRIVESKKNREGFGRDQLSALINLGTKLVSADPTFKFEVFSVIGNTPYTSVHIINMSTAEEKRDIPQEKFKLFMRFKIEFDDL